MEFYVHALQGLLHVLLVTGAQDDMIGAQSLIILQAPNVLRWHKTRLQ